MEAINEKLLAWLQKTGIPVDYSQWVLLVAEIILIFFLAYVLYQICHKAVAPAVHKLTSKTESKWDDILFNDAVLKKMCHLVPPVLFSAMIPAVIPGDPYIQKILVKVFDIYIIIIVLSLLCALINSLYAFSSRHEKLKDRSMKGFYQMLKLVVICVGAIIIIAKLIGQSPAGILTGLGAGAAILSLVFQDTIKGLVAGVQLTANDMIRPGDWISAPKYNADGDVIEVSLTTVKVRNWDKTITTVPPYVLVNDSFQNWRGMYDSGGRRVKRSVNIDMHSVRFCTAEEMAYYRQQPWMEGWQEGQNDEVNLSVFRRYLDHYLRHNTKVHQELQILVRQLQPTPHGLPLELYFFSADTSWANYEALQSEVFEHVFAVVHQFGLKVFQSPTGLDLQSITVDND